MLYIAHEFEHPECNYVPFFFCLAFQQKFCNPGKFTADFFLLF